MCGNGDTFDFGFGRQLGYVAGRPRDLYHPCEQVVHERTLNVTGTDIAGGSIIGASAFQRKLKEHSCDFTVKNIAIAGSTASQWSSGSYLENLKSAAKEHDYVWITLMGNDALAEMPTCASKGEPAQACGDQLESKMIETMGGILDDVHASAPSARIVGFGYDVMFGGIGCEMVAKEIFPQCWKNKTVNSIECFNTEFVRLQKVWTEIAAKREWVDVINILGTTQIAGGDNATIGHPDLTKFGPSQYWPTTLACIHPSLTSLKKDGSGAMIIMEEFYTQYWSEKLGC